MQLEKSFPGSITARSSTLAIFLGVSGAILLTGMSVTLVFLIDGDIFDTLYTPDWMVPFVIVGLSCSCFGFSIAGLIVMNRIRKNIGHAKVEEAIVTIEGPLRPGQSFDVRYDQQVKKGFTLRGMTAKLVMREWVRYTAGTNTYTKNHDVVLEERVLSDRDYTSSSQITETVRFQLPKNAMHTWDIKPWVRTGVKTASDIEAVRARWETNRNELPKWKHRLAELDPRMIADVELGIDDNKITWHVLFKLDIPNTPDYNQGWELPVLPIYGAADETDGGWF